MHTRAHTHAHTRSGSISLPLSQRSCTFTPYIGWCFLTEKYIALLKKHSNACMENKLTFVFMDTQTHTHTLSFSVCLSLSQTHTHTHTHTYSLTHTHRKTDGAVSYSELNQQSLRVCVLI